MSWDKENFEILRFFFLLHQSCRYLIIQIHLYPLTFIRWYLCVWTSSGSGSPMNDPSHFFFIIIVAVVFNLASLLLLLPLLLPDGPGREVSQLCLFTFHRCEDRAIAGGDKGWPTWTHNHTILTLRTGGHFPYLHLFLPIIQCYFLIQCYFVVMTGGP